MAIFYTLFALSFSVIAPCAALVARATLPFSFSVQELGFTTESDTTFNGVGRDGGGGGHINGFNLIVFSDTETLNSNNQVIDFKSNSVAYSNATTPTSLTDFGSNGVPDLGIPFLANESAWADANNQIGSRLAIWPGSSITPMPDGVSGVAVYNVTELSWNYIPTPLYNTMVKYTPNSSGPQAVRIVPQLFYVTRISPLPVHLLTGTGRRNSIWLLRLSQLPQRQPTALRGRRIQPRYQGRSSQSKLRN